MTLVLILIGGIAIFAILLHFPRKKRPTNYPPGPTPIPILGNLHQVGLEPHKGFVKLGKKYGGIFAFDYGSYQSVVINDLKLMKQCLNDLAFAGRPRLQFFLERTGPQATYCRGIIVSEKRHWSEQRRFVLKNLRDFGFDKSTMEGVIQEEITEFIDTLRKDVGRPIKTRGLFNTAVLNSLWRIVSGSRTAQNDPRLQELMGHIIKMFSAPAGINIFFPTLTKWFPVLTGYDDMIKGSIALREFVKESFLQHKATFIPGQPRDLIDSMCEEIAATTDPSSSFYQEEGEESAIKSLEDLFLGGAETTSTTLSWIFLALALHPEVQEKLHQEINMAIGASRLPELSDRVRLPYTECVIMEVLRYVSVFPLSVMHSTLEEVRLGGYVIPKDIVITPNLYAVLHDEEIWGDPETFRPERFLLPDGTPNKTHEAFFPFSYGKRVCIGEKLAKDELFLFTASLFQHFRVSTVPNQPKPQLKSKPTIILSPVDHELILYERL